MADAPFIMDLEILQRDGNRRLLKLHGYEIVSEDEGLVEIWRDGARAQVYREVFRLRIRDAAVNGGLGAVVELPREIAVDPRRGGVANVRTQAAFAVLRALVLEAEERKLQPL